MSPAVDDDQNPVPTPPPLVRQPLIPAMFAIVPAIIIALVIPGTLGIFIAAVLFIGQSTTLYRVFNNMKKKIEAEHPGIFDRPSGSAFPGVTGPTGGPVQDPPQGPIIS